MLLSMSIREHVSFVIGMHIQVKGEMVTVDSSVYADGLFTLPITQVKLGGQEIEGPVVAARLDISAPYSIGKLNSSIY